MTNVKRFTVNEVSRAASEGLSREYVDIADYSLLLARLERMQKALKKLVDETERCDQPGMWGVSVDDDVFVEAREALEEKP